MEIKSNCSRKYQAQFQRSISPTHLRSCKENYKVPETAYDLILWLPVSLNHIFFFQPVLVITTGKQTTDQGLYTPLDIASSRLQKKGAAVFVLGIGKDVDTSELTEIASSPGNVFTVDSFRDLYRKTDEAKRGICILGIFIIPHSILVLSVEKQLSITASNGVHHIISS